MAAVPDTAVEVTDLDALPAEVKKVGYFQLYRYADKWDVLYVIIGSLSALTHGVLTPLFVIFFGDIIDDFGEDTSLLDSVTTTVEYIAYLACAALVTSYFQVALFTLSAQRQTLRIRKRFFTALIRQEMAWFDSQSSGALATRISQDVPKIQEGMGDKVGSYLQFMGMFIGGFAVGFSYSWKLTLVVLSVAPLIGIGGWLMSKMIGDANSGEQGFYASAGSTADEAIRMIRTVIAFHTQNKEQLRYDKDLSAAKKAGIHAGVGQGAGVGFTMLIIFLSYGLTFWYGSELVRRGELSPGDVIITFFSVIIGSMSLGQAAPSIAAMAGAQAAAHPVFEIIEREPEIDSLSEEGIVPKQLSGRLTLSKVHFTYPSRPDEKVLQGLSLDVQAKETVALVGSSGCGKSTVMQLIERFYDPASGTVELDGEDIRALNIQWLRSQIALVSQTPVLFPTTIFDNIALGKDHATEDQVIAAAKMANAHDFIMNFPDKYQTMVGDSGAQMSGGQRQRIAIARALVKSPDILLLDEATSALDNESEIKVKEALDQAAKERTTILIAHRLSTVFSADRVAVIQQGKVVEIGTPQQLLDQQGHFYNMVALQYGKTVGESLSLDVLVAETETRPELDRLDAVLNNEELAHSNQNSKNRGNVAITADLKEEKLDEAKDKVPEVNKSMLKWTFGMNRPESGYIIGGSIGAALEGLAWPVYAIILAEVLDTMNRGNDRGMVNNYAVSFVGLAIGMGLAVFVKYAFLGVAGERLTMRLRSKTFAAMMSKDAAWHDMPENSRGILTTRLSADAAAVRGMMGDRLALAFQVSATVIGSLTVALIFCWRVGLVILGAAPFAAIGGALQFKLMSGFNTGSAYERSGKFASQAMEHVRTVASLGRLSAFVDDYIRTLEYPTAVTKRTAQIQGISFGFSEFSVFGIWALAFWWGAKVVDDGHCDFSEMFKSQMAIVFMGMVTGQASTLAPDYSKALAGAKRLYVLITGKEEEDKKKQKKSAPPISGALEFRDVTFSYPTRPDVKVLNNFSLKVAPGETVALVGSSGCGKSTVIALAEQFYPPASGTILIDGHDVSDVDEQHYRSHFALVSQQPELFAMSIKDNITYGFDGTVPHEQVVAAAKAANAHDFIMEFEHKYDTQVGAKGAQLSGGQRQRIAISRALLRGDSIKVLLLDEATAALDTTSEKLVHEALDRAQEGRTTLIVAHRLSTIKNADRIAVVSDGHVVEIGSHDELMAQQGFYADLVQRQEFVSGDDHLDLDDPKTQARPQEDATVHDGAPPPYVARDTAQESNTSIV